ncbi:unnamed protein product, partial [Rotaria sp. Silwood2]
MMVVDFEIKKTCFLAQKCKLFSTSHQTVSVPPIEQYVPSTTNDNIFNDVVEKAENFGKYHQTPVRYIPEVRPIEFYEQANLDIQVLSNIRRVHEEPTPVQRYTIPCIREEDDIIACAQTGFDKT